MGATIRLQSKNYFTTHLSKTITNTPNNWNGKNVYLSGSALTWEEALTETQFQVPETADGTNKLPVWRKNMSLNLIKKWFNLLEMAQSTVSMEKANNYGPNPISYWLFHEHRNENFFENKYPRTLFHAHDLFNIFLELSQIICVDSNSLCELNYNNIGISKWDGINPKYATKRIGFDTLCLCVQPLVKTMMNTGSSETISVFTQTEHKVRMIGDDAESWNRFYFILPPRIQYQLKSKNLPSVPKMEINSWMKEFLRSSTDTTTYISPGVSADVDLTTLSGIQCVNTGKSLTDIQTTLSDLNKLIMPSVYDFRKFATGIWNHIYSKYQSGTEWTVGEAPPSSIWKEPTSGILQPLNNYFQYGPTAKKTTDLRGLLPGLSTNETIVISGSIKDYFPWYYSANKKQPLHCTSGDTQFLIYGIEPTEEGYDIRMQASAYPRSMYNYYFQRSSDKRLVRI